MICKSGSYGACVTIPVVLKITSYLSGMSDHPIRSVIIIGPAHPLRSGGLTTFNHRLAREFSLQGFKTAIYSFSLQYPSFLFPGTSQYTDEPAPPDLQIKTVINSVSPMNWWRVGEILRKERPDLIVVRFWIPFMGPALGTILRRVRKNHHTRIICIADNIQPHERRFGDTAMTRYFVKSCDAFVAMSEQVRNDLQLFVTSQPVQLIPHPIYDVFGERVSKNEARAKLGLEPTDKVILFFGFIRKYKGLDMLLEALADPRLKESGIKLLIAGEYYADEAFYTNLMDRLHLRDRILLHTHFIADKDVPIYFGAADVVVQPYRSATQSGVTPAAYHFEVPMIVTDVGGLPEMVPDGKAGIVTTPTVPGLADAIVRFYTYGEAHFIPHLREEKRKYAWSEFVDAVMTLAGKINR
jgi:glycosyltransferase involved in cell wall biosynthesis